MQDFQVARGHNERVPLALRLTGHLMLGVVQIFRKQVFYLHLDCVDAQNRIGQARLLQSRALSGRIGCVWVLFPDAWTYV